MITGGIDAGIKYTKIVIANDDAILYKAIFRTGGIHCNDIVEREWEKALDVTSLSNEQIDQLALTGIRKHDITLPGIRITEAVAVAKAAKIMCPEATMAVSVGADETIVLTLAKDNEDTDIDEMTLNQKCAAGIGLIIDQTMDLIGMKPEEVYGLLGEANCSICDGCAVFAELDVLEALNQGLKKSDVMLGLLEAMAVRVNTAIHDITFPKNDCILLVGGMTENIAFVNALERQCKVYFNIPNEAVYAGAIGAAKYANENCNC